jgi:predicted RNA-binding Zn-ribbon protein involved in translation (DUF1610 family)
VPDTLTKCSVCGALLDEEDLFCANCGTETPKTVQPTSSTRAFDSKYNFECQGCGASMSYDASAQTLRCPFCGSTKLSEQKDAKSLEPEFVVPFVLSESEALERLREWLRQGFWRPGDLAREATVTKLTQVYVPFWVFAAKVFTYWTADTSQTPRGAMAAWYPLFGENSGDYRGVLVGASSVLTPTETSALCPFDLAAAVPPDQVDLNNVVYEQFRVQRKYARPLAQSALENLERDACTLHVPGNCRNMKVNTRVQDLTGQPALLPVWIFAYRYRDRFFRFLVNGQNGQCTGSAPLSLQKIAVATAVIVLVAIAILVVLVAALSR